MANAFKVTEYLTQEGIDFEVVHHTPLLTLQDIEQCDDLQTQALARAVLLKDEHGMIMAILPASHVLDYAELCRLLSRTLEPITGTQLQAQVEPLLHDYIPPLPKAFGFSAIIDNRVCNQEKIYLDTRNGDEFISLNANEFLKLAGDVFRGEFSIPFNELTQETLPQPKTEENVVGIVSDFMSKRLKQRVEEVYEMPIIPDIARQLLELRIDPDASAVELSEIVEMDPSLSAQVISWARSPYYGYSGAVDSVEHAIIRVLGFDLVMSLAVGLAIGKSMNVSYEGPLGLKNYWQSAINSATLMDKLSRLMPNERPSQGLAYLTGLLHNFGYLILGHVFPKQYRYLNHLITLNPLVSVHQLQRHVFGLGYDEVGAVLLRSWNLPEEVCTAVEGHTQQNYQGEHQNYTNLLILANRLLKRTGIGYSSSKEMPLEVLAALHIEEGSALEVFEEIIMEQQSLRALSRQMI